LKKVIVTLATLAAVGGTTAALVSSDAIAESSERPVVAASQSPERGETMTSRSTERPTLSISQEMQLMRENHLKIQKRRDAAKARQEAAKKAELMRQAKAAIKARQAKRKRVTNTHRTTTSGGYSGSAKQYALNALGTTQFQCFSNIVTRESGWNYKAVNSSSGAYGLMQALPGSKMASAGADWATNPITQVRWGISYMNGRYGSPCGAWGFWQAHHWY